MSTKIAAEYARALRIQSLCNDARTFLGEQNIPDRMGQSAEEDQNRQTVQNVRLTQSAL
jgi:hypothetical protein